MESRTKNAKTRAQIERMARKAFKGMGLDEGGDAVRELRDGWFNAAYALRLADGREVILKIAPAASAEVMRYESDIMATEVATMRLVRENAAIPAPAVLFYDDAHDACDSSYFFMEKIAGDNLDHVYGTLPLEQVAAIDREIGKIIREVNSFRGSFFGYDGNAELRAETWKAAFLKIMDAVFADAANKQVVFDYGYPTLRAAVHKHADALDEVTTPCLVHWDAWNPNFFVSDGHVTGIIDFERALWADPLMEAQFRALCWGGVTESLRGYGKTEFTPTELRRCWLYLLHLALVMHVECYFRQYGNDEVFNKSRELIASAMGWLEAN
ncbi:aminoglycoside phosphotransferase family protein [Roseateles asaccharophilus]|uniref:Aminoglycoside phosphotransferase (APT) family kinase protein n=1 Tax=Roseateles asaccharophilus TaxID=582607 RepID=A0ABU2AG80_9BURK|nr:aminoglycoside phosphotransferase family protein [Roseateles asaccharophilus]MDR7334938.1 aminoglycoside phosphotransferase (APT) family kinase protein [Roseateles asaccharophilus]